MMKKLLALVCGTILSLSVAYSFTLTSSAIKPFSFLNAAQVCTDQKGGNTSPELSWSDVPKNTKALVLFVHDPDAPVKSGFVHWVVYINNAHINHLNTGMSAAPQQGIYFGLNGLDENAFLGACPPEGTGIHRYEYTLYALDKPLNAQNIVSMNQNEILNEISDRIIDQAILTAFYKHS